MRRAVILVIAALGVVSCASRSKVDPLVFEKAPLFGMIYDADNQPCAGVLVTVDGKPGATTDIRGRFMLPGLSRGDHRIEASGEGYEDLAVDFAFLTQTDALYLRMISLAQLIGMAEDAIDQRRWDEARGFLDRAERVDGSDPVLLYLRALLAYRQERYEEAVAFLDALIDMGVREAHVYLLLADLHEKHLENPELAKANLASYLDLRADSEVQERLKKLETSPEP